MCGCLPGIFCCCYWGQQKDFSLAPLSPSGNEDDAELLRSRKWTTRLQAFRNRNRWFGVGGSVPSNDDLAFALLLSLYSGGGGDAGRDRASHESALCKDLLTLHGRDPMSVEFYLPQLVTYLSLHQFSGAPEVQNTLLTRFCQFDLRLAHRVYWHLVAFCPGNAQAHAFRAEVEEQGCRAAALFNDRIRHCNAVALTCTNGGRSPRSPSRSPRRHPASSSASPRGGLPARSPRSTVTPHAPPPNGTTPTAAAPAHDAPRSAAAAVAAATTPGSAAAASPPAAYTAELTPLAVSPVAAGSGDAVVTRQPRPQPPPPLLLRLPSDENLAAGAATPHEWGGGGGGDAATMGVLARDLAGSPQHFHSALYFIEALARTSEELIGVPPAQRQDAMCSKLERLNEFFLSDAARVHGAADIIYIPFGECFYQVRAIHPEECIVFSTKERVPVLVCLEVCALDMWELAVLRRRRAARTRSGTAEEPSLVNAWKEAIANNLATLKERLPRELTGRARSPSSRLGSGAGAAYGAADDRDAEVEVDSPGATRLLPLRGGNSSASASGAATAGATELASPPTPEVGLSHLGQWRDARVPSVEEPGVGSRMVGALGRLFRRRRRLLGARADSSTPLMGVGVAGGQGGGEGDGRGARGSGDSKAAPLLSPGTEFGRRARSYSAALREPGMWPEEGRGGGRRRSSSGGEESTASSADAQEHQSALIFRERWSEKEDRIWRERERAAVGDGGAGERGGWRLLPIIVKANDDLRQEQAVSQMVASLHRIFVEADVGVWLRPYEILATSPTAGILEAVPDTVSLHALKRNAPGVSLPDFFRRHFGAPGGVSLKKARSNFVESCAGYAIVCYLLQVKDRHNGNILLDAEGHLLHIDWGFVLGRSPGRNMGFESAPFKLTHAHVEVMGGPMSFSFQRFRNLCVRAYLEARRNSEKILLLVEMLAEGNPDLPCFSHSSPTAVCEALRERFLPGRSVGQCVEHVGGMIDDSMASWSTPLYDKFQRCCVGIF